MKEKWVQINTIEGYENVKDHYWLSSSDEDKIINRSTGKMLKISIDSRGYKRVGLQTKGGKWETYRIHVLKAKVFIYGPNLLSANMVRHLNDIKTDNRLENLAWGTQSQNAKDSMRNGKFNYEVFAKNLIKNGKRISKPVRCIETGKIYSSACEAGRQLGIRSSSISNCCNNKCKTAGDLHFEFVDQEETEN